MSSLKWLLILPAMLSIFTIIVSFNAGGVLPCLAGVSSSVVVVILFGAIAMLNRRGSKKIDSRSIPPEPEFVIANKPDSAEAMAATIDRAGAHQRSIQIDSGVVEAYTLIPFAKAILAAVPKKTEQVTLQLIDTCMLIKNKANQEAQLSQESLRAFTDQDSEAALPHVIQRTREAINRERENIAMMVLENRANTDRLRSMSQEIDAGIELLHGIDDITQRSWVIAINLAVEAGHIGEKGRGFQVIAGELHSLNTHSAEYSTKVAKMLNRFKEYNAILISTLLEQSTGFAEQVEKGFMSSLHSIESLVEASTLCGSNVLKVAQRSQEIDTDLQGLLESLQFQDITRQMVEGAIAILDDLTQHLETMRPVLETMNGRLFADYLLQQEKVRKILIDRSKTLDEKQAITGVVQ